MLGKSALRQGSLWPSILAILAAATLFGTTGTALAKGPADTDPWAAASLRLWLGGVLLTVLARRHLRHLGRFRTWIVVGSFGVAGYQTMFFAGTERTGVAVAALTTIGASPLASRVIGGIRGRRAPGRLWWLAAAVLGSGLVLQFVGADVDAVDPVGVVFALLAGIGYAVYAEAGSVLIERGLQSTASMAVIFLGGAVFSAPILLVAEVGWVTTTAGSVMLAYQGAITLTVAYVAFGWGLRRLTPSLVVMLTILEPAVASILAVLVLNESLSVLSWIGAGLILAGLPIAGLSASRSTVEG